jgi:hypothetical protein
VHFIYHLVQQGVDQVAPFANEQTERLLATTLMAQPRARESFLFRLAHCDLPKTAWLLAIWISSAQQVPQI